MARMRIPDGERVRVKLECLRLIVTLKLDPARTRLLSAFVDTYLRFTGEEQTLFEREVQSVPEEERGKVMELTTSWKEEGREEGRQQATLRVVLGQLAKRLGALPEETATRARALSVPHLEDLAEALLDFQTMADLEHWLAAHRTSHPRE